MATTISGSTGISTQSVTTDSGAFYDGLQRGTAVTASGTSVDFTGIPSWVKRVTVMYDGVSTNGTSVPIIQLGDSGGIETTGYLVYVMTSQGASLATSSYTTGYPLDQGNGAAFLHYGAITFTNISANSWVGTITAGSNNSGNFRATTGGGSKTLSATLDRIRITTVNGTDTFDAGTINIIYE